MTGAMTGTASGSPLLADPLPLAERGLAAAEEVLAAARRRIGERVAPTGAVDPARLDAHQFAAHGLAWLATYVTALRELRRWAERLEAAQRFGELEALILQMGFGEYLAQIAGGIALSQGEIARPADLGLDEEGLAPLGRPEPRRLIRHGNSERARARLAELLKEALAGGGFGASGIEDPTLELVREQFRRFGAARVTPFCQGWHLRDELIPPGVIEEMASLGVFGLTVPEEWGGEGLGKLAMCIVSEELSRAYIGVGSLGTRSEIAAELIRASGTEAQKQHFLRRIATGEILPTAAFTEPDTGSDLASLRTRAVRDGDTYRIHGAKTWMTHG